MDGARWDSLEVAKLAVGALTPLTVALIGIGFARVTRRVEAIYANRPFFSADTLATYEQFMATLFKLHNEPGTDARLRTGLTSQFGDRRTDYKGTWQESWERSFATEADQTGRQRIIDRHDSLLARLSEEVGADAMTGQVP